MQFNSILELDEYFCEFFSKEIEILPSATYKEAPLLQAVQHNIYDYYKNFVFQSPGQMSVLGKLIFRIRNFGYDHQLKWVINKYAGKSLNDQEQGRVVFFADNYVPRILEDFLKVMRRMDPALVAFHTTDYRAYRYIKKAQHNEKWQLVLMRSMPGKTADRRLRSTLLKKLMKECKPVLNEKFTPVGSSVIQIIRSNFRVLCKYYDSFTAYLDAAKPIRIILGSDGFSVARVLCYVAKKKDIETATLQHGLIDSLNGYLPLISDKIIVWSGTEKKLFQKRGVAASRVWVLGAPRFEQIKAGLTAGADGKKQLLYIISPGMSQDVLDQVDLILQYASRELIECQVKIRPHPYYRDMTIKYLAGKENLPNVSIDEEGFQESISKATWVVFGNISTAMFETVAANKPSFVVDGNQQYKVSIYELPFVKPAILFKHLTTDINRISSFDLRERLTAGEKREKGDTPSEVIAYSVSQKAGLE